MSKIRQTQVAGQCVFCRGNRLTKEHVFPDWISKVLGKDHSGHNQFLTSTTVRQGIALLEPNIRSEQGDLLSRKVRKFCKGCNSGWMSRLQGEAKPIIVPLIRGNPSSLSVSDQATLCAWLTMTSIVLEFTHLQSQVISLYDRDLFFKNKSALAGWRYWIGRYESSQDRFFNHRGVNFAFTPNKLHYLQTTTLVFGSFFAHVFSSDDPTINYNIDPINEGFLVDIAHGDRPLEVPSIEISSETERQISNRYLNYIPLRY